MRPSHLFGFRNRDEVKRFAFDALLNCAKQYAFFCAPLTVGPMRSDLRRTRKRSACARLNQSPTRVLRLDSDCEHAGTNSTSSPVGAVQAAVLDGFRDVLGLEIRRIFQIGDGAGDFQDAVVGAGAQALLGHGAFEQAFAVGGEFAEGADVAGRHLRVAVELFAGGGETLPTASGGRA